MRILSLPPPHHWETTEGTPVEGWAYDEHDGLIVPVVYDEAEAGLVTLDAHIRRKSPARGQFSPYGKYMADDPRKGTDE